MAMIEACGEREQPMLGVCLGHQALGVVLGATVGRAPELLHGKTSQVHHDGTGVLEGAARPVHRDPLPLADHRARRRCPTSCVANGRTESGIIMAVRHATLPLHGVQFHPESVLTHGGHRMLANWLQLCGDAGCRRALGGPEPARARRRRRRPDGRRRLSPRGTSADGGSGGAVGGSPVTRRGRGGRGSASRWSAVRVGRPSGPRSILIVPPMSTVPSLGLCEMTVPSGTSLVALNLVSTWRLAPAMSRLRLALRLADDVGHRDLAGADPHVDLGVGRHRGAGARVGVDDLPWPRCRGRRPR